MTRNIQTSFAWNRNMYYIIFLMYPYFEWFWPIIILFKTTDLWAKIGGIDTQLEWIQLGLHRATAQGREQPLCFIRNANTLLKVQ